MKNNYILLFILLCVGAKISFAQDGVFKSKKIEISFAEIHPKYNLVSLELYQNGIFATNEPGIMGYRSYFNYDHYTNIYTLRYTYTGIGGGSNNSLKCPLLLVQLNLISEDHQEHILYVPIELTICETSHLYEIKVLNIDLNPLIAQPNTMIKVSENNAYQIVPQKALKMNTLLKIN